ncbi:MAG: alpha-amylase [Clostridia bacterium]|nr:alpha-amylase [Clostridia bacterium]
MFKQINNADYLAARFETEFIKSKSEQAESKAVINIAFVVLAENGNIDEVTASEHTEIFAEWAENVSYAVNNIRRYEDNLYKCLQAHTSQAGWTPDVSASLWKKIGDPTEEYPEWSQPIGASDAYQTGDKVSYNGNHYVSTVNNNVWAPDVYGWERN